ncbi:kinase-like domain-containing protein, partial [Mycena rebaudengoi]
FNRKVSLSDFNLLRRVGEGALGEVRVVQHKQTRELYILKYINKGKCVKMREVPNVIQERQLLEETDHPFIVKLRYAFQDPENCFFVLDFMMGSDLRYHLERFGPLEESVVRFWVAQLSSAVRFLHDNNIMHRDIKPDNILLDERGNAHLTDLNIARKFSDELVKEVAGSMAYMAPEILTQRGYTYHIDWWALGVCAFELMFDSRPFRGRTSDNLTYNITHDSLQWPKDANRKCSRPGIQVLKGLLAHDPARRFGCKPDQEGYHEFQRHPWFTAINWDALESKEHAPPFVLDARMNLASQIESSFDIAQEWEDMRFEGNQKPRKAKTRTHNSPERRHLEAQ